ncbi:MAG: hypothetical protein MUE32_07245 [Bacteroidales bacterium]|nr:hypothetical protein [Bacteroidales bacterium]
MNRKKFTILISMMLLSVIGILWVQISWISDAVRISNDAFNRAVFGSMQRAAGAIESSRKMNFFNDFILADRLDPVAGNPGVTGFLSVGSFSSNGNGSIRVDISNQTFSGNLDTGTVTRVRKSVVLSGDTSVVSDSVSYLVGDPDGDGHMNIINSSEREAGSQPSVYVGQNEFMEWVRRRSSEFRNLSDQMISEIYQWEKTMEIEDKEVHSALRQSFLNSGINTPFEFAVIRNGDVRLVPESKRK